MKQACFHSEKQLQRLLAYAKEKNGPLRLQEIVQQVPAASAQEEVCEQVLEFLQDNEIEVLPELPEP